MQSHIIYLCISLNIHYIKSKLHISIRNFSSCMMIHSETCTFQLHVKWVLLHWSSKVKKVKMCACLIKHHAMKTYEGAEVLNLGTKQKWVVSFTPRLLTPTERALGTSLIRSFGGPQSRYARGDEKNIPAPAENRNPVVQTLAQS